MSVCVSTFQITSLIEMEFYFINNEKDASCLWNLSIGSFSKNNRKVVVSEIAIRFDEDLIPIFGDKGTTKQRW